MASFHTHIAVSTSLGAGLAWLGHDHYGLEWSTCAVAGGLCAIGGLMPDLDSDSGVPARETIGFAAAVIPMVLFNRLQQQFGLNIEQMLLLGAPIYLFIRFGLGTLLKLFTVHRGMFHSLPAAAIAGMVAYLICDQGVSFVRVFKACGLTLGYLSHLVLDEIWSVEVRGVTARVKNSFGTALKLFGNNATANSLCYGWLLLAGLAVLQEGSLTSKPSVAVPERAPASPAVPPTVRGRGDQPAPSAPKATVIIPPERRPVYEARDSRFDFDFAPQ
jgi:hypothetical protein